MNKTLCFAGRRLRYGEKKIARAKRIKYSFWSLFSLCNYCFPFFFLCRCRRFAAQQTSRPERNVGKSCVNTLRKRGTYISHSTYIGDDLRISHAWIQVVFHAYAHRTSHIAHFSIYHISFTFIRFVFDLELCLWIKVFLMSPFRTHDKCLEGVCVGRMR